MKSSLRRSDAGVGYVARVSRRCMWLYVENRAPVHSGSRTFTRYEKGTVARGSRLYVVRVFKGGAVLAHLRTKGNKSARGSRLPTGTLVKFDHIDVLRNMEWCYRNLPGMT